MRGRIELLKFDSCCLKFFCLSALAKLDSDNKVQILPLAASAFILKTGVVHYFPHPPPDGAGGVETGCVEAWLDKAKPSPISH
ncbi:hypothetical protein CEXT_174011 [Caerostris extrusa]|uniref:Uncharacterized protein n=1 Tax=Caerostris extrusa TaxID=172846 RepID=A0AAV4R8Z1_CAEEX|nr:hypothetical protein CEXT_174011 [Caerostris extrusa]